MSDVLIYLAFRPWPDPLFRLLPMQGHFLYLPFEISSTAFFNNILQQVQMR